MSYPDRATRSRTSSSTLRDRAADLITQQPGVADRRADRGGAGAGGRGAGCRGASANRLSLRRGRPARHSSRPGNRRRPLHASGSHRAALALRGNPTTGNLAFDAEHAEVLARFERGELYDSRMVDDLRQALVATGLFNTVSVLPEQSGRTRPATGPNTQPSSSNRMPVRRGRWREARASAPGRVSASREAGPIGTCFRPRVR